MALQEPTAVTADSENISAMTVSSFAEATSTDSPTPGGGAVCGATAALAAALAGMAGRFALKRDIGGTEMSDMVSRADALRSRCCDLADADAHAYAAFAAARQAPDRASRRAAMDTAREQAAQPPLELAGAAREIADIGLKLVSAGNPNLRSDACAAALLASAAATASAILVGVNVGPQLSDIRLRQATDGGGGAGQ